MEALVELSLQQEQENNMLGRLTLCLGLQPRRNVGSFLEQSAKLFSGGVHGHVF